MKNKIQIVIFSLLLMSCGRFTEKIVTTMENSEDVSYSHYIIINAKTLEVLLKLNSDLQVFLNNNSSNCESFRIEKLHINFQKDTYDIKVFIKSAVAQKCDIKSSEINILSTNWVDYENFSGTMIKIDFLLIHSNAEIHYNCVYENVNGKINIVAPISQVLVD